MKITRLYLLLIFLFFLPLWGFSQELSGFVFNAKDSIALESVTVYFDGTNIGTITNSNGFFKIKKDNALNSPLIISSMGYETIAISNATAPLPKIYLNPKAELLDEVVLSPDPWSRKKKLAIFKREFLGASEESKKCKIINEDDIKLHYNPNTKMLSASADAPLILENKYLGYRITYNLMDFIYQVPGKSDLFSSQMCYYSGTSFYEELKEKVKKRFLKAREEAYNGSTLHFMRSLSEQKLTENGFQIFHENIQVPPYKFFVFKKSGENTIIKMEVEKIIITHKDFVQSAIIAEQAFTVDSFGNHSPPDAVTFSGNMAGKRLTHTLPLNYQPEQ